MRVERVARRIDVGEHRRGPEMCHHLRRRDKGERRHDHFVSRADTDDFQREAQRVSPGRDPDAVRRTAVTGELALERLDLGAEDVLPACQHPTDGLVDLPADRGVLPTEIDERHHDRYRHQYATLCLVTASPSSMPRTSTSTPLPLSSRSRSTNWVTVRLRNSSCGTAITTAS